jgi:hypothetical protein
VPVYLSGYGTAPFVGKPVFRIFQDKFLRRLFDLKRE